MLDKVTKLPFSGIRWNYVDFINGWRITVVERMSTLGNITNTVYLFWRCGTISSILHTVSVVIEESFQTAYMVKKGSCEEVVNTQEQLNYSKQNAISSRLWNVQPDLHNDVVLHYKRNDPSPEVKGFSLHKVSSLFTQKASGLRRA